MKREELIKFASWFDTFRDIPKYETKTNEELVGVYLSLTPAVKESEKPITAEEVLDRNGFDFAAFEFENEHSAKNLLSAMEEYASLKPTVEPMTAEEGNYIIVREQNSTRVYRNGEKLHPNDVPIVMCQLSDKERELLDKIQQQYAREIESTEKPMTAEEFIREKIRQKFELKGDMMGLWCYSLNGEDALRWAHEYASKPTGEERYLPEDYNIQSEVAKIHHQYGTTELANYRIEQLSEKYAGTVRKSRTVAEREVGQKQGGKNG